MTTPLVGVPSVQSAPSWRSLPARQQPQWPDASALDSAVQTLGRSLPLVFPRECDLLKRRLAAVARGEAFLVQGGDCAESLDAADAASIGRTVATLRQLATVLGHAMALPVVTVGRLAGQYAKPRSASTETRDGLELPVYRGDAVNGSAFTAAARTPDPQRLVRIYNASAATLNLVRAFGMRERMGAAEAGDGLREFAAGSPSRERYEELVAGIEQAGGLVPADGVHTPGDLFTSHEGLLLDYESALTRTDVDTGKRYAVSGHLLWIGERTRQLDGAHVAYFAGISNPIAVKVGPGIGTDELLQLIDKLDPERDPGRLTLIVRMGAERIRDVLPDLIAKVTAEGIPVGWMSDPMHGNTIGAPCGRKTRRFDDVLDELSGFFEVTSGLGVHPGGVHLELTGDDVTECVGGAPGLTFDDLPDRYRSLCDPRLNREQALDLAFRLADTLPGRPGGRRTPAAGRPGEGLRHD